MSDLTLTNVDTLSQNVLSLFIYANSGKIFLQRVTWNVGTGHWISTGGSTGDYQDRVVIENSTLTGAINTQYPIATTPDGASCSGMNISGGPVMWWSQMTNFWFRNNSIYGYSGQMYFNTGVNLVVEDNTFTQNITDTITVTSTNLNCLNQDWYREPHITWAGRSATA